MSLENVAVLDAGSFVVKAGLTADLAGEDAPSVVIPSAVRDTRVESCAGGEAQTNGIIDAVKDRAISDWDAYEAILDEILYSKLGWTIGDEGALLAAEDLFVSRDEREKLTQLVFEHNNTAGFFLCSQPVLSLYALGKLSGSVVDIGHTTTDICTVFEGQVVTPTTRRLDFGMQTVSHHLRKVLQGGIGSKLEDHALSVLSQAIIRVPASSEEAKALQQKGEAATRMYTLPDGQEIQVAAEGLQLGEALVDGRTIGLDVPPTATALHSASTSVADVATRKAVLECLSVCGGGSAVSGLSQRLLRELRLLLAPSTAVALAQAPEYAQPNMQQYAAWMGGAITSKIVFSQNQHVSKADYDEHGPAVVHLKCCMA